MAKVRHLITLLFFLWMSLPATSQGSYEMKLKAVDKDPAWVQKNLYPPDHFSSQMACREYLEQLLPLLQSRGYIAASIDSLQYDSTRAYLQVFIGQRYQWNRVTTTAESLKWLSLVGYADNLFNNQWLQYDRLENLQGKMLRYFENNGYPFAKIFMDQLDIQDSLVSGRLNVQPGPLYRMDSIKVTGTAKISSEYLQNYLGLKNGSAYNKEQLQRISGALRKLNYIQETEEPRFHWGSTGGLVELFLDQKKSSQVHFIVGFLPNTQNTDSRKLRITGEGLLNLNNALGSGERIGLEWQKLEAGSQKLHLAYDQPYLFQSPFGLDIGFDMLKRDTTYLNFDYRIGAQYSLSNQQNARLFFNQFTTIVSTIRSAEVLQTRQLPREGDVKISNLGVAYHVNTTNYIFNPISGVDFNFSTTAGIKKIKPNSQLLNLKDPNDPDFHFGSLYDTVKLRSYQLRSLLAMAYYLPLSKKGVSTLKAGIQGGYLGGGNIFRNELFQIGGYRLLRGFDEQSQYLSQYAIGTLEYRYLVGENSYFNAFADGGWGRDDSRGNQLQYIYLGLGLGLAFETKVGIFNLAWAIGKRNDTDLNLRQSKIHFGFINYF